MVDPAVRKHPDAIERLGNELLLAPVNIPILVLSLLVIAFGERPGDAVGEIGLKPNTGTTSGKEYLCTGKWSFLMYFRKYSDILILFISLTTHSYFYYQFLNFGTRGSGGGGQGQPGIEGQRIVER
jgi:hypothetical protein